MSFIHIFQRNNRMVKKWEKQLQKLQQASDTDFETCLKDIFAWIYDGYDIKPMQWYPWFYRIRIGTYRIIFSDMNGDRKIFFIGHRWQAYKHLHHLK